MISLNRLPMMQRLGKRLNEVSEYLGGRNHRTLFAGEGIPRLPAGKAADQLVLASRAQALSQLRVYMLPGTAWPGVAEGGAAWLKPWGKLLEKAGVDRAVPVKYGPASDLHSITRMFTDPLFNTSEERALQIIHADLAARPLAKGQQIFLIGHSYGAKVGSQVADTLSAQGLPVKGVALLGARNEGMGNIVKQAPHVPQVVEIENVAGKAVETARGTALQTLDLPELSHMDMVLKPPTGMLDRLLAAMAGGPSQAMATPRVPR